MASVSYSSPMSSAYMEIKVACSGLHGRRVDAFAVLMQKQPDRNNRHKWTEITRTETVHADRNPAFVESFEVLLPKSSKYLTAIVYRIAVFHHSSTRRSADLSRNTFLGYTDFALADLLEKPDGTIARPLASSSASTRRSDNKQPPSSPTTAYPIETSQVLDKRHSFPTSLLFPSSTVVTATSKRASVPLPEKRASDAMSLTSSVTNSSSKIFSSKWTKSNSLTSVSNVSLKPPEQVASNTTLVSKREKRRCRAIIILSGERVEPHRPSHMYSVQMGFQSHSCAEGPTAKSSSSRKPSLFYVIYRALPTSDTDYTPVYRSEVLDIQTSRMNQINFQSATIRSERLHGMNQHRSLRIEFFHHNPHGPDASIGYVQTSASSFKYAQRGGKLFVVPNHAMNLASAYVVFDSAAMGKMTRRGTISSVFSLYAGGFVWGVSRRARASANHLDIDCDGRDAAAVRARLAQDVPRGVSYMSLRALQVFTEENMHEEEECDPAECKDNLPFGSSVESSDVPSDAVQSSPRSVIQSNVGHEDNAEHTRCNGSVHEPLLPDSGVSTVGRSGQNDLSEKISPTRLNAVTELQSLFSGTSEHQRVRHQNITDSTWMDEQAKFENRSAYTPSPDADDFLARESSFRSVPQARQAAQVHVAAAQRLRSVHRHS